jgi:hypothetical protein
MGGRRGVAVAAESETMEGSEVEEEEFCTSGEKSVLVDDIVLNNYNKKKSKKFRLYFI